jgi:serine/threonine protein phosphatase PrpC
MYNYIMKPSLIPELPKIIQPNDNVAYVSDVGLVKVANEDRLDFSIKDGVLYACIADGHWGDGAAQAIIDFWTDKQMPASKDEAVREVTAIQTKLYEAYGKPEMDENVDFTPETAFVFASVQDNVLSVVSYGDCRLLIVNDAVKFSLAQNGTWLGAFSHLGLRKRLSVDNGLVYEKVTLEKGDRVILFTDGLDECIYEKPTISFDEIAADLKDVAPAVAIEKLLTKVYEHGAEDNVSIFVYKF